jgi:hypothetical protein
MEAGIYLRRDIDDKDSFFIEIVTTGGKIFILLYVFIDALSDIFGLEIGDWANKLRLGQRVKIQLKLIKEI